MEQATAGGYVRRDPSERDRRRCVVWLTGRGAGLLSAASVVRATPLEGLLSGRPDEDVTAPGNLELPVAIGSSNWR